MSPTLLRTLRTILIRLQPTTSRAAQRVVWAMLPACAALLFIVGAGARWRTARTTADLKSAVKQLAALTDGGAGDDLQRAAIAWGYAERLRLGLESPFRLIEASARDPRLSSGERRTVSWALLARVLRGESHEVDAAALDILGPWENGHSVSGEQHLALITDVVANARDPRAGELAVRFAYTLASAERLVDGAAALLAAETAAMIADRELARREAKSVVRSARGVDPIEIVRVRRAASALYVERPVLLAPSDEVEQAAIALTAPLLDSLRSMRPMGIMAAKLDTSSTVDASATTFAPRLFDAGARVPPVAPLAVTVQQYLPLVRSQVPGLADALKRVRTPEMLVAAALSGGAERPQRRAIGRLLLAAAVSVRSLAQEPVWFEGDSSITAAQVAGRLGLAEITFDGDVPSAWRSYFLRSLAHGVRDVRRVLPTLRLDGVRVRFRMQAPADSALAMHDPRTRTLHLPVPTAGGTLIHELAHDLDRQSARKLGLAGYRSDNVARAGTGRTGAIAGAGGRVSASLQALTRELSEPPRGGRPRADRPAEIFATRVDWFVASALARQGISSGFLSAVQDELLTGHVVHQERLRSAGRTRSLLTALEGMTTVAPFASIEREPSAETLLHWALSGPVDRRSAGNVVRGETRGWTPNRLLGARSCDADVRGRAALLRMVAETRARGWLRQRARSAGQLERPAWARSMLGQAPWSEETAQQRTAELRDFILVELATSAELRAGLAAHAAPLALEALCVG